MYHCDTIPIAFSIKWLRENANVLDCGLLGTIGKNKRLTTNVRRRRRENRRKKERKKELYIVMKGMNIFYKNLGTT
jgi:hypothetical protein